MVERVTVNDQVVGSSPASGAWLGLSGQKRHVWLRPGEERLGAASPGRSWNGEVGSHGPYRQVKAGPGKAGQLR